MIERFARWAEEREDVRGAVLVGSRARSDHPADEFSDIDLILVVRDPDTLLDDGSWLAGLGDVGITFVEQTPVAGVRERRVLFADGVDVDVVVVGIERAQALADEGVSDVFSRGARVLVDKDGLIEPLVHLPPRTAVAPSEHEFREMVADFWYHALWTARKLARGELFTAKSCCDSYMKWLLVRMLGWHAGDRDTWHEGRFLEEWADPQALAELRDAYADYDAADVERALHASMALFSRVARETADKCGFAYPAGEEELARRLVADVMASGR